MSSNVSHEVLQVGIPYNSGVGERQKESKSPKKCQRPSLGKQRLMASVVFGLRKQSGKRVGGTLNECSLLYCKNTLTLRRHWEGPTPWLSHCIPKKVLQVIRWWTFNDHVVFHMKVYNFSMIIVTFLWYRLTSHPTLTNKCIAGNTVNTSDQQDLQSQLGIAHTYDNSLAAWAQSNYYSSLLLCNVCPTCTLLWMKASAKFNVM